MSNHQNEIIAEGREKYKAMQITSDGGKTFRNYTVTRKPKENEAMHDDLTAVLLQIIEDVKAAQVTGDLQTFYERMGANAEDAEKALAKAGVKP